MQVGLQDAQPVAIPAEVRKEFQVLTTGCGIFKLDRAHIALTGADRVRWLNGMVTNNIRDLAISDGVYAFLLNPQGKIQADLYAFNRGESLVVETESSQVDTILQIFDRYIIMDEVEVENLAGKFTVIGLAGPGSAEVLTGIGFSLESQPRGLQISDIELQGRKITLVRGDNPSVPNYELWVEPHSSQGLWDSLLQGGAQLVHADTLEVFRVACGIPKFGVDIRQKDLPQETGQDRALNFSKGCYIGQEIVERIRSRGAVHRMFTGFEVEGPIPTPGFRIQHEGKDVAELTSVATIPTSEGEPAVALGYGRKELMVPGKEYVTGDTRVRVAVLPFSGIFPE
jgi:folate-binding protein YgfZ